MDFSSETGVVERAAGREFYVVSLLTMTEFNGIWGGGLRAREGGPGEDARHVDGRMIVGLRVKLKKLKQVGNCCHQGN